VSAPGGIDPRRGDTMLDAETARFEQTHPASRRLHERGCVQDAPDADRRRPSPRSYHEARRPHAPQRPRPARRGRTCATTTSASSSNSMSSMTVFSTPSRARHRLAFRTPLSALWFLTLDKPET
jgi:hypothetical protein